MRYETNPEQWCQWGAKETDACAECGACDRYVYPAAAAMMEAHLVAIMGQGGTA